MSQLGRLVISLEASTAQFTSAMTKAEAQTASSMAAISSSIGNVGLAVAAAMTAAGASVAAMVTKTIEGNAELANLSEQSGLTVESLSALKTAATVTGTQFEGVIKASQKLGKSLYDAQSGSAEAGSAFKALGINLRDTAGDFKSQDAVLLEVATRFSDMEDGTGKVALAQKLLGKSGADLISVLNELGATGEYMAKVSTRQAQLADDLDKTWTRLRTSGNAMWQTIANELTPSLDALARGMLNALNSTGGLKGEINKLASDGTFAAWAQRAAVVTGELADAVVDVGRFLGTLFESVKTGTGIFAGYGTTMAGVWKILHGDLTGGVGDLRQGLEQMKAAGSGMVAAWDGFAESHKFRDAIIDQIIAISTQSEAVKKSAPLVQDLGEKHKEASDGVMALFEALGMQNTKLETELAAWEQGRGAVTATNAAKVEYEITVGKLGQALDDETKYTKSAAAAIRESLREEAARADTTTALIKIQKDYVDSIDKLNNAFLSETKAINDATAKMVESNATFGMGKTAVLDYQIAQLEMTRAVNLGAEGMDEEISKLDIKIEALKRLRDATGMREQLEQSKRDWDAYAKMIGGVVDSIEQAFARFVTSFVDNGASRAFRDLWDNFKRWALEAIAKVAAQRIVVPIVASVIPGLSSASGLGGGSGGFGGSILNLLGGGGGSLFGSLSSGLGGVLAGMETGFTTLGIAATEGISAIGGLSSALGALGAVAGPIAGIALAAYAAWSIFGNKGGGPKGGGFYSTGDTTGIYGTDNGGRWFTPSTEDSTVKTIVEATAASYTALLKQLGGKGTGGFALGFDTDPNGTAPNRVHAGAWVNGVQVYNAALGDLGRDTEKLKATLELESKRAVLAAIQASDLPEDIAAIIDSLNASTATSDMIDNTIAFAEAIHGLNEIMKRDPVADALEAVTRATEGSYAALMRSGDAMRDLVANYDGSVEATQNLTAATAAYYQQQVALLVQIEQVRQAVESMFGDTIRSLTLTTLDDPGKYDFLMNEANSLMAQLATETDPDKIRQISQRINQDILDAFGLLSPDDQRSMLGQFTGYAQAVSDAVSTRLSQIGDEARQTVGDVLALVKEAFQQAVNDFVNAATTQQTAADTQLAAANTPIVVEVNVASLAGAVNA